MDGPDDSSPVAPTLDAGTANAPPHEMAVGADASVDDSTGDASLDSEPTTDAATQDSSPVSPAAGDGAPSQGRLSRCEFGSKHDGHPVDRDAPGCRCRRLALGHDLHRPPDHHGHHTLRLDARGCHDQHGGRLPRVVVLSIHRRQRGGQHDVHDREPQLVVWIHVPQRRRSRRLPGGVDHTSPFQGVAAAMVTGTPFNSPVADRRTPARSFSLRSSTTAETGRRGLRARRSWGSSSRGPSFSAIRSRVTCGSEQHLLMAKSADGAGMVSVVSLNPGRHAEHVSPRDHQATWSPPASTCRPRRQGVVSSARAPVNGIVLPSDAAWPFRHSEARIGLSSIACMRLTWRRLWAGSVERLIGQRTARTFGDIARSGRYQKKPLHPARERSVQMSKCWCVGVASSVTQTTTVWSSSVPEPSATESSCWSR